MANLTLAIDDDLLRTARVKAVQEGTSVNQICREAIERFARPVDRDTQTFLAQLRELAARMPKGKSAQPLWMGREAMYEQAMAERMPTLWASFKPAQGERSGGSEDGAG